MKNLDKKTWVKNSLGFDSNLYIFQDKTMFNYSIDTILLGNFCSLNSKIKNVLEIGTNNGALSIFVSERNQRIRIDAIEIQERAVDLAKYNVFLNKKQDQIKIILSDFNFFWKEHNKNQLKKYDLILCNPPFYQIEKKQIKNISEEKLIATYDLKLSIENLIKGSAKIIKEKGYFSIVVPTERLVDCFSLLRKYNFEPKKVQFVHPRIKEKSILVLIESRFNSGWGTKFLPNIYLHPEDKSDHSYLEEVKKLYKPIKANKEVLPVLEKKEEIMKKEIDKKELKNRLDDLQWKVTQENATEKPFSNIYDSHFEEGIYVDIVDGTPLFVSTDKYDSGCGWPAFSKPIDESMIEKKVDLSHGMKRIEIRSKNADSHLGHVFEDGPKNQGGLRFCINSASLNFIKKEDLEKKGYKEYLSLFKK